MKTNRNYISGDQAIFIFFYPALLLGGLVFKSISFFEKETNEYTLSSLMGGIGLIIGVILEFYLIIRLIFSLF
jgi:hypothetical protein